MQNWELKLDEYGISKNRYRELRAFCLQYPEWKEKEAEILDSGTVPQGGPAVKNHISDPTQKKGLALILSNVTGKIKLIEDTARDVDVILADYLILNVTTEYNSYPDLAKSGMVCSKNNFYRKRRQFFFYLNQKLQ